MRERYGVEGDAAAGTASSQGNLSNDEPVFAWFRVLSEANLAEFVERTKYPPVFVRDRLQETGFAELVRRLLATAFGSDNPKKYIC
jgi:hypothetical protein